jgi:hypothetical protein
MGFEPDDANRTNDLPEPDGPGRIVETFSRRLDAHAAADFLIFSGISVDRVEVKGRGAAANAPAMAAEEPIPGRVVAGWAFLLGTLTGAWCGLLVGLLVSFLDALGAHHLNTLVLVVCTVVVGAIGGAILGIRIARGDRARIKRSMRRRADEQWDVVVDSTDAPEAIHLLAQRSLANRD